MDTKLLTTHVPAPLADKVNEIAARLDRSSDWVVEQAVIAWVSRQEDRYRETLEALADVDRGLLRDHAFIEKWADGLGAEHH